MKQAIELTRVTFAVVIGQSITPQSSSVARNYAQTRIVMATVCEWYESLSLLFWFKGAECARAIDRPLLEFCARVRHILPCATSRSSIGSKQLW
jgi:hypothetical protein